MTELDDRLLPRVAALLSRRGKTMAYTQITRTRDSGTGETTTVEVTHSVLGTPPAKYSIGWRSGDGVKLGDVRTSLAGQGLLFTPNAGDTVAFDGTTWRIITVHPVYSGESTVLWTLQLRR